MSEVVITGLIAFFGLLFIFILNKVYENRGGQDRDRGCNDTSVNTINIYQELLHITTTVTKLDMGMDEVLRLCNDSDSKFATVKVREELHVLRKELNLEIEKLRLSIERSD